MGALNRFWRISEDKEAFLPAFLDLPACLGLPQGEKTAGKGRLPGREAISHLKPLFVDPPGRGSPSFLASKNRDLPLVDVSDIFYFFCSGGGEGGVRGAGGGGGRGADFFIENPRKGGGGSPERVGAGARGREGVCGELGNLGGGGG